MNPLTLILLGGLAYLFWPKSATEAPGQPEPPQAKPTPTPKPEPIKENPGFVTPPNIFEPTPEPKPAPKPEPEPVKENPGFVTPPNIFEPTPEPQPAPKPEPKPAPPAEVQPAPVKENPGYEVTPPNIFEPTPEPQPAPKPEPKPAPPAEVQPAPAPKPEPPKENPGFVTPPTIFDPEPQKPVEIEPAPKPAPPAEVQPAPTPTQPIIIAPLPVAPPNTDNRPKVRIPQIAALPGKQLVIPVYFEDFKQNINSITLHINFPAKALKFNKIQNFKGSSPDTLQAFQNQSSNKLTVTWYDVYKGFNWPNSKLPLFEIVADWTEPIETKLEFLKNVSRSKNQITYDIQEVDTNFISGSLTLKI